MREELNRHKRRDRVKWIFTFIALFLAFVMLIALCMQIFGHEKLKPENWFKKPEQTRPEDVDKTEKALNKRAAHAELIAPDTVVPYGATVTDDDVSALGGETPAYDAEWKAVLTVKNNINSATANSSVKIFFAWQTNFAPMQSIWMLYPKDNVFDIAGCVLDSVVLKINGTEKTAGIQHNTCYFVCLAMGGNVAPSDTKPSAITSIEVTYNLTRVEKPIPLPDDPVKEGHTFLGWYFGSASDHNNNCTKYDGSPIYSDTKLHAHFQINRYTVSFNSDGGSSVANQTVDWGTSATLTTPTRDGYAFKGWFLPNGTQYTNQAIKSNTSLTARWERNRFTITFNSDGGSAVENKAVMLNNSIPLTTPTKEGYNFKGWFMSDGTQYTNQPVTADMTLTARWEIKTFTVTFYVDGEVYDTKTVEYGSQLVQVADEVNVYAQNIISFEYINEVIPETEAAKMLVVDDMKVYANKATDTDKLVNTVKNNKWQIIGGVVGGIALIAVVAGIVSGTKRKKR